LYDKRAGAQIAWKEVQDSAYIVQEFVA
jgi:hypothetical protein